MIYKEIQINVSRTIHVSVWGKEETKELEGIPKEKLTLAIQEFVADKLKIPSRKVFLLDQVHGDRFFDTKNLSTLSAEGDALYTTEKEKVLVVKTADCMPLFFWSEIDQLIGVIHSGWKGTHLGISEKLFHHLQMQGYSSKSIHAYLGPCARKKNYEVGNDLFELFKDYSPEAISHKVNHKYLLGVDIVLRKRLIENNLPIQLSDSKICTMDDRNYHSHRCGDKGRNLNLIWMS